jgi:zeaxanthin glucosyltransferase
MGTILNGRVDVFLTIVAALAKHKDLQLVLSIGDQVDPEQIGPVPNNAIIVKQAPQLELLKQTSVCITGVAARITEKANRCSHFVR